MDVGKKLVPATVSEEQLGYARWLDIGTRLGLVLLVVSFGVYVSGLVAPHVPLSELPGLWVLPVDKYLAATGLPSGWGWIAMIGSGDVLNFVGIAFLSLVTVGCYARLALGYFRKSDLACAWIVLAEICVLVLAASGLVSGGH